jgi:hypothetical protein
MSDEAWEARAGCCREASHEGHHFSGGGHGKVGAVTEEDHSELRRRRLRGAVTLGRGGPTNMAI